MRNAWAIAAVAIAIVGAIVALSWMHADTTALLAVLLTVIGGFTISTHQQTNGNTSKLIELVSTQSQQLAHTMPPLGSTTPTDPTKNTESPGGNAP